MARKAGSGDGAEVGPERPEDPSREDVRIGTPAVTPPLEPGEPSWPEDPAALRTETMAEDRTTEAGSSPSSGPDLPPEGRDADSLAADPAGTDPDLSRPAEPARRAEDPPSGWDWEAGASGPDETPAEREAGRGTGGVVPPVLEPGLSGAAAGLGASAARPRDERPLAPASPPPRRGGTGALLLGGVVAAALGFGAAWLAQDRLGGAGLPADLEERLAALEARPLPDGSAAEVLAGRVAGIEERLTELEEAPAAAGFDPEPLREEIAAGLGQAEERAAALEERLAALEARPAAPAAPATDAGPAVRSGPQAGTAAAAPGLEPRLAAAEAGLSEAEATLAALDGRVGANEAALSDLDGRLGEAESRLDAAEAAGAAAVEEARAAAAALEESRARATAAEAQARREAAIAALDSALDAGQPFEAALPALGADAPEALARAAAEGVPSLAALRESFPEAARAGLAAARREGLVEDGGVLGFLGGQLSLRSTAPREGTDPDAVLSRAEAALAQSRLPDALAEIDALPEPVRAAMADWIAAARTRAEAEAALAALRDAEPTAAPAD